MSESYRSNAKFIAARTNLLWGVRLSHRNCDGDPEQARELFERALELTSANSYANVVLRAHAALAALEDP